MIDVNEKPLSPQSVGINPPSAEPTAIPIQMRRFLSIDTLYLIITVGVIGVSSAFYYFEIREPAPCSEPMTYSIGTFDKRFGVTEKNFLNDIGQAGKVWSNPIGKELFTYSPTGGTLTINLIYDERQQSTDKLEEINSTISVSRSSYDSLHAKYISMKRAYTQEKADLEKMITSYRAAGDTYSEKVKYWNERGGAPRNQYQELQRERTDLNTQAAEIRNAQEIFNTHVAQLNSTGDQLNALAKKLNINVDTYNTVGASLGQEFEEGEYVELGGSLARNRNINIYQFSDDAQLRRILAHELGHALGLDHINTNKDAIMYYLNTGSNQMATIDDVVALKTLCKIK